MKNADRKKKILELLRRENGQPVQMLAAQLGVSHMTVRRDLEGMAAEGTVRLIHGGVLLPESLKGETTESLYSLHSAGSQYADQKKLIGIRAAKLVEDGDALIIDSGSTTECFAANLPVDRTLTVLSYALNIITATARMENVRSIFAGGDLHRNTLMFESPEGNETMRRFRANKAFISAAGVSREFGVTCLNAYERETKKIAIETAARKILLVDASKFGKIRTEYFAELSEFDVVVSDSGLADEHRRTLEDLDIELILA